MGLSVIESLHVAIILFCAASDCFENPKDPLFLTPYIDSGKINEGRDKAIVQYIDMKSVKSYAGYITINQEYKSNTFFWYFPAQNDSITEPLLLWMNGGPGSSSLLGLFEENGPFSITKNLTLEMREYSWHRNHNVLYIDNPVGTGFSFTENDLGYANSADDVGRDVLTFLVQFFKLFPELKNNDFYVTGESYAGKYAPAVSHAIKIHNKIADDKINLKGLAISNGFTDPVNQMNYSEFYFNLGFFDSHDRNRWENIEDGIRKSIAKREYEEAAVLFDKLFACFYNPCEPLFDEITKFEYPYNVLETTLPEKSSHNYEDWVELPDVKEAIHVGKFEFNDSSPSVINHLKGDMMQSVAHYVEDLLEDYKVLLYSGQLDMIVPYVAAENYIKHLNWTGAEEYKNAKKKQWYVGQNLAGYVKTVGNLNRVLLRNAGHFVTNEQPHWVWELISRFTHNRNL